MEKDNSYFVRRAAEEARLAATAVHPAAVAAHQQLSAVYRARALSVVELPGKDLK